MLDTDISPSQTDSKHTESLMAKDTNPNYKSTNEIGPQELITLPEEIEHTDH